MEVGSTTMAAREISINKANTGQDILQKTLEKSEEIQQNEASKPVNQVKNNKQGGIDIFA